MPLTPHPKDHTYSPPVVPDNYDVQVNNQQMQNQANETQVLNAKPGQVLGQGGETKAFAKGKVDVMGQSLGETTAVLFQNYETKNNEGLITGGMLHDPTIGGDRGMITRQVASYQADRFLGLNMLSEEKYGQGPNGTHLGVSVQVDGTAVSSNQGILDVDYSDPRIQRGLSDLETSDFIMGQVDRHAGNIFIDPATGRVKGIDNDMSLPEVSVDEVVSRDVGLKGKVLGGMPKRMHEETAKKILATDPEAFRRVLSQPPPNGGPQALSEAAINGAVERLKAMQEQLRLGKKGGIQVVKNFDKKTYQAAMKEQAETFDNYRVNVRLKVTYDQATTLGTPNENRSRSQALITSPKSSYLGVVECEKQSNKLAGEGQRPMHKAGNEAGRNPRALPDEAMMAEGYRRMTPKQQQAFDKNLKEINKLEGQLEKMKAHLTKLDNPKGLDKLSVAFKGGKTKAKASEQKDIQKLEQKIDRKLTELKDSARNLLPPLQQVNQNVQQLNAQVVQQLNRQLNQNVERRNTVRNETGLQPRGVQQQQNRENINRGEQVDQRTVKNNKEVVNELGKKLNRKPTLEETNPELKQSLENSKKNVVAVKSLGINKN